MGTTTLIVISREFGVQAVGPLTFVSLESEDDIIKFIHGDLAGRGISATVIAASWVR